MEIQRSDFVPQLQELLVFLNDGKEGYRKAALETSDRELRAIFMRFSESREKLANDMRQQISNCGGDPQNKSGGILGKIHRRWLDIKTALSVHDDQVILETCRNGDQAVMDAYDDILQGAILETSLKPFLMNQRIDIHQEFLEIDRRYFSLFKPHAV